MILGNFEERKVAICTLLNHSRFEGDRLRFSPRKMYKSIWQHIGKGDDVDVCFYTEWNSLGKKEKHYIYLVIFGFVLNSYLKQQYKLNLINMLMIKFPVKICQN